VGCDAVDSGRDVAYLSAKLNGITSQKTVKIKGKVVLVLT
jgi:hypothetical protein